MISNNYDEIELGNTLEGVDGPVRRQAINHYAETSGDRNPIHTTYKVAMAAGLSGVIQHGLFSMAWLIKTFTDWLHERGKLEKIDIQFRAMVRPNDLVYSKGKVIKKYKENGKKLMDLEINQEAWGLLCKGIAQAMDKSIDADAFQKLLSNVKLGIEIESEIEAGEVKIVEKQNLKFESDGIEVLPNSLSFWEAFTRGWYRKGDKIRVKLLDPPENGKAEFAIYKVSNSIKGTATVLFI
jgi:acyl dehydratase